MEKKQKKAKRFGGIRIPIEQLSSYYGFRARKTSKLLDPELGRRIRLPGEKTIPFVSATFSLIQRISEKIIREKSWKPL
jgi:hypothetical protein